MGVDTMKTLAQAPTPNGVIGWFGKPNVVVYLVWPFFPFTWPPTGPCWYLQWTYARSPCVSYRLFWLVWEVQQTRFVMGTYRCMMSHQVVSHVRMPSRRRLEGWRCQGNNQRIAEKDETRWLGQDSQGTRCHSSVTILVLLVDITFRLMFVQCNRAWIICGLFASSTHKPILAVKYQSRALEVLDWGSRSWKAVSTADRGCIFEHTFIRGVRRLHVMAIHEVSWHLTLVPVLSWLFSDLSHETRGQSLHSRSASGVMSWTRNRNGCASTQAWWWPNWCRIFFIFLDLPKGRSPGVSNLVDVHFSLVIEKSQNSRMVSSPNWHGGARCCNCHDGFRKGRGILQTSIDRSSTRRGENGYLPLRGTWSVLVWKSETFRRVVLCVLDTRTNSWDEEDLGTFTDFWTSWFRACGSH